MPWCSCQVCAWGPALTAPGSSGTSEGHMPVIPSPDAVPDTVNDPVGALPLGGAAPRGSPKPAIWAADHLDALPENPGLGETSTTGTMVAGLVHSSDGFNTTINI